MLLRALSRVRDPALRARVLDLTLAKADGKDAIDGRASFTLLLRMLSDDENRAVAFDYVRAHLDALEAEAAAGHAGDRSSKPWGACARRRSARRSPARSAPARTGG
jgi:hypothetical protein